MEFGTSFAAGGRAERGAGAGGRHGEGVGVSSFGAGAPAFGPPERIKAAAVEAMRRGQTKYTEVGGIAELRAGVCAEFKRDQGLDYPPDEGLVSCGGQHTPH